MDRHYNKKSSIYPELAILLCIWLLFLWAFNPVKANSGLYLNSSHANSTYGVNRTSLSTVYPKGSCAHCHEQHASIGGSEPNPTGGPDKYALFYSNYVSQTDNFCLKCHTDTASYQSGGLINRSYSYRAGGWTADTLNDIKEAFSNPPNISSHSLDDIKTFVNGKWGYTVDSTPCNACHNPHAAQGDPPNTPNNSKSSGARGWPVSRPTLHSKDNNAWGLWGDISAERMNNYTLNYQAPYRYNSTTAFEPDGSSIQDGSNLTDFVTFCTDCHNATNTIYSTPLGRNLRTIDWDNEKHGKGNADNSVCGDAPYPSGAPGSKVLSCLDCHEPHGSPNAFLIRKEVNGGVLGGSIGSFSTTDWHYLCDRCHKDDKEINSGCQEDHWYITHHSSQGCNTEPPYSPFSCGSCHIGGGGGPSCGSGAYKKECTDCHYHGSFAAGRRTF